MTSLRSSLLPGLCDRLRAGPSPEGPGRFRFQIRKGWGGSIFTLALPLGAAPGILPSLSGAALLFASIQANPRGG
jgi:hypothetical protein